MSAFFKNCKYAFAISAIVMLASKAPSQQSGLNGQDIFVSCSSERDGNKSAVCSEVIVGFVLGYQTAGNIAVEELPYLLVILPEIIEKHGENFMSSQEFIESVLAFSEELAQFCVPQGASGQDIAANIRSKILANPGSKSVTAGAALAAAASKAYPC